MNDPEVLPRSSQITAIR